MTAASHGPSRSLRGRLLLGILGGVLALWCVTLAAVWVGASHELDELLDGHLAQAAALIAAHGGEEEEEDGHAQGLRLGGDAKRVLWQVWRKGELQRRSAEAPATALAEPGRGFSTREVAGSAWRVYSTGTLRDGTSAHVAERLSSRRDILGALTRNLLWPMLVALPLLALAILLAIRASLAPLDRIGTALAARGPLALEPLPGEGAPAEVRPLLEAMNALFARIGRALAQEKRFTADAAHELRTPIAALRAQAQVALACTDPQERQDALQAVLDACDRAARLLEQLLTLARLDTQDPEPVAGSADLDALARSVMAQLADQMVVRGADLELRSGGPALVRGEPVLLGVLLRNLVDNALRYSPPGAAVLVSLERDGGRQRLRIEDGGPGLDEAALARLGERFFRLAPDGPPGTGLGWSIVQRIAALHRATVVVDRSPSLGGLRASLEFPPYPA
jgi:two-component system sensor histidine kinase QseC